MLPEHRLATLFDEVKNSWIQQCTYHNTADSPSLFVDHTCSRGDFPQTISTVLKDHGDEVWFLAFSPDGRWLATAGKDCKVIIYRVAGFVKWHEFQEHKAGVCYVAWSPDSTKLITCGKEGDNSAIVWDIAVNLFPMMSE
jgi:WD repeat-containing protein 26